jgi:hypothetical protein
MKDIIALTLFYMVWNTPIHVAHPTAVPVMLTLYLVIMVVEYVLHRLVKREKGEKEEKWK